MSEAAPAPKSVPLVVTGGALPTLLFFVVIISALYLAREVLVPIALAVLLSFVLAPLVRLMQAWHMPRVLAVPLVVIIAFGAIVGIGGVVASQVNQLAFDLPSYQATLREKIKAVRGVTAGSGTLEKAAEVLEDLGTELRQPKSGSNPTRAGERPGGPIPVEIKQPDPSPMQTVVGIISPLIHPLATTGIVFIFVIFILLQREDLRNRLIRLAGVQDLQRTTLALDEAGQRLSRLFLTQLVLNAGFGVIIGIGLFLIGVPSAALWGILAMILRFVPYIGAVIAAVFPLVLAAAVGPGWTMVVWTALLFAIVEPLVGHVVEPFVTGQSSGISPVAVIASATFWTWLWGPIGLVLATPLTLCLVVLGRHVDRLKFLDVMFGDESVLSPVELVYQRMLAGDAVEATEQAELYIKESNVSAFFDNVLVQSLSLADSDARNGELRDERLHRVRETAAEIIHEVSDFMGKPAVPSLEEKVSGGFAALTEAEGGLSEPAPLLAPAWNGETPVLCMAGHGPLDETLALVLAQLVRRRGLGARHEPTDALSFSRIDALQEEGVALVCLCYLGEARPAQVRYAMRRLRRKLPEAIITVCLPAAQSALASENEIDGVTVTDTLLETVEGIVAASRRSAAAV